MNRVSLCGGETCGSVSNRVNFSLNETTGSVSYLTQQKSSLYPARDTVSFKSRNNENKTNYLNTLLWGGALTLISAMGLAYAHKINAVDRINNDRIRNALQFSKKITEPCYDFAMAVKENTTKAYKNVLHKG